MENTTINYTINDLRAFPFKDSEFVRFLKERGVYNDYIKELNKEKYKDYQRATILFYNQDFFGKRRYVFHAFPFLSTNKTKQWNSINREWDNKLMMEN